MVIWRRFTPLRVSPFLSEWPWPRSHTAQLRPKPGPADSSGPAACVCRLVRAARAVTLECAGFRGPVQRKFLSVPFVDHERSFVEDLRNQLSRFARFDDSGGGRQWAGSAGWERTVAVGWSGSPETRAPPPTAGCCSAVCMR